MLELIRLERFLELFQARSETICAIAHALIRWSMDPATRRARARRAVPGRRRGRVSGAGRSLQGSGVRVDRAHGSGSLAGRGSGAGSVPARSIAGCRIFAARRGCRPGFTASSRTCACRIRRRRRIARCRSTTATRAAHAVGADRQFGDLELRDRLEKAIARLPANYRLLIAAHYLQGVQYEDLAEALKLPLGTVKTQLHRAKQQLRRLLETELNESRCS